eukprot:SM000149S01350  [mRNA]  locus=s149:287917:289789:+ [translate_table: standard]
MAEPVPAASPAAAAAAAVAAEAEAGPARAAEGAGREDVWQDEEERGETAPAAPAEAGDGAGGEAAEEEEEEEDEHAAVVAEWAGVAGVAQDDGPAPAVPIAYSRRFREAMDLLRAALARHEASPRALRLTAHVLGLNAANYTVLPAAQKRDSVLGLSHNAEVELTTGTLRADDYQFMFSFTISDETIYGVWHFRRVQLEALGVDLHQELRFVARLAADNTKNYQLWYHRRWVACRLGQGAAQHELDFTRDVLALDAKNYHAWLVKLRPIIPDRRATKQWVLRELGGWEGELEFCSELLLDDVRNNSAWNQRYMVITEAPELGGLDAQRAAEVAFAAAAIQGAPGNESPWRYLRGLFHCDYAAMATDPGVVELWRSIVRGHPGCVAALSLCLDLLGRQPSAEPADLDALGLSPQADLVAALCVRLALVDPIRSRYWAWRQQQLGTVMATAAGTVDH